MRLVVVGHGPTGHRLVEALCERDTAGDWDITVVGEVFEPERDQIKPVLVAGPQLEVMNR